MSAVALAYWPQAKKKASRVVYPPEALAPSMLEPAEAREVDLGEVMRQVVSQMEVAGLLRGAEVLLELPGEPPQAVAVRWKLEKLAFNLLANAAESAASAGEGQRSIRVLVEGEDVLGDHGPTLHVRDSGPVLTQSELSDLFSSECCGGRGHLAAARTLVEELGGDMRVKSRGAGTTVVVELPVPSHVSW